MLFLKGLLFITIFQAFFIAGVSCKKGRKGKKGKKDQKVLKAFNKKVQRYLKTGQASSINQGCVDEVPWCAGLEDFCKFDVNVQTYCRKMCKFCVVEEVCEDWHPQCKLIFEREYCPELGSYCQKTCGVCKGIKSECGLAPLYPSKFGEIVDGLAARRGYFPWQVGIYIDNDFHCGGALIDRKHVISAAHCFNEQEDNYEAMRLTVGDIDRNVPYEAGEQEFTLQRVVMHPYYDYDSGRNDIVLLELSGDVTFYADYVGPICLPEKGEERQTGSYCSLSGWGRQNFLGPEADVLQYVQVPVVEPRKCKTKNNWKPVIETNICTGFDDGTSFKGACFGDSGGPLSCKDSTGVWKLFGAVSWGHPQCNAFDGYTVFTKVSSYIDWIQNNKS